MVTKVDETGRLPLTELEQPAFCQDEAELRTRTLAEEFAVGVRWQKIPMRYMKLTPEQIGEGIASARKALGSRVLVLGHHYQRDDVIRFADVRGDSYKLSKRAAEDGAEYILFCGVHFMAETADILTGDDQSVVLPNLAAGCSMADMAQTEDVHAAWDELSDALGGGAGGRQPLVPVTYMNSTASIKALCGENGGLVCTSSNASAAFEWAYERGERILFLPDQHLGRNTGLKHGIGEDEMVVWNPFKPLGGCTPEELKAARLILWQGHCSVHTRFTVEQIEEARRSHPGIKVIVHPECTREVVDAADMSGSTELILDVVSDAPAGTEWAIGTEISMVKRLAAENPDKRIICLDKRVCPCATMYRIHPAYVLWVLEGMRAGVELNHIKVPAEVKARARVALERMLEIGG